MKKNIVAIQEDFGRIISLWMMTEHPLKTEEIINNIISPEQNDSHKVCLSAMLFELIISINRLFDNDEKCLTIRSLLFKKDKKQLIANPFFSRLGKKECDNITNNFIKIKKSTSFEKIQQFRNKHLAHKDKDMPTSDGDYKELFTICLMTYKFLRKIERKLNIDFNIQIEYLKYWRAQSENFWSSISTQSRS